MATSVQSLEDLEVHPVAVSDSKPASAAPSKSRQLTLNLKSPLVRMNKLIWGSLENFVGSIGARGCLVEHHYP